MTDWTAEQVRSRNIAYMGQSPGELYTELSDELQWLHIKWQQYRALYGKDQSVFNTMNRVAPLYFM